MRDKLGVTQPLKAIFTALIEIMAYYITTDATCDYINPEKHENFRIIPMVYLMNGEEYGIEKTMPLSEFYEKVSAGAQPTTSLITTYVAKEVLSPILKDGFDILHICFSSGLSGSYANLAQAVDELRVEFPDRKIFLIDSKCAAMGESLLNDIALKSRENGMTIEENYEYTLKMVDKVCHYFTVNDLFHLQRGGRVSKAQAIFGTALGIMPVMYCNADGRLVPIEKVRSRKKALITLADIFAEHYDKESIDYGVYIAHADSLEDAEFLKDKINKKTGVENINIGYIGPVIGSHTGKGCIALFFVGDTRIEKADKTINQ